MFPKSVLEEMIPEKLDISYKRPSFKRYSRGTGFDYFKKVRLFIL